jgi:hypothetical protein
VTDREAAQPVIEEILEPSLLKEASMCRLSLVAVSLFMILPSAFGQKNLVSPVTTYSVVAGDSITGEIPFWIGIDLLDAGHMETAIAYLVRAYRQDPRWAEVIARLPAAGLLPQDEALIDGLIEGMKKPISA